MNHGQQPGVVGMPNMVGISPSSMMASSPQQQMPGMMSQQQNPGAMAMPGQPQRTDKISKVKSLIVPLRDSLSTTLKQAAQLVQHNNMTDNGNLKGVDNNNPPPRFDKNVEEFYSICDQIELHLKSALQCMQQSALSQRYLPVPVASTRIEPIMPPTDGPISYSQYLSVVPTQIAKVRNFPFYFNRKPIATRYAKDIHDTLICAASVVKNDL